MSLKTSHLIAIRRLPKRKQDFLTKNQKGKNLLDYFNMDATQAFSHMARAIKEARKVGMTLPSYLAPLTEAEKKTIEDAYIVFTDPIKLDAYMDQVSDDELLNVRLLLLKDRIETGNYS